MLQVQLIQFFGQTQSKRWQHANATYRNIFGRNMLRAFGHRVAMCCDMLVVVGSSLKLVKFEPTTPNMSQHDVATSQPNARNMLRPTMLRYVALACCHRLAGVKEIANIKVWLRNSCWYMSARQKFVHGLCLSNINLSIYLCWLLCCLLSFIKIPLFNYGLREIPRFHLLSSSQPKSGCKIADTKIYESEE